MPVVAGLDVGSPGDIINYVNEMSLKQRNLLGSRMDRYPSDNYDIGWTPFHHYPSSFATVSVLCCLYLRNRKSVNKRGVLFACNNKNIHGNREKLSYIE